MPTFIVTETLTYLVEAASKEDAYDQIVDNPNRAALLTGVERTVERAVDLDENA